jgi:opacity protein-like surface antigen
VGSDYNTWNVGISAAITDHLTGDLRYSDTSKHEYGKSLYGDALTVSLKAAF